jgi:hypothetical protein
MALVEDFCVVYTTECGLFKFQDKINWGSPEQERSDAANILIAAHVTQKGVEEFVTIDSAPYLSKIEYDINNTVDGHYLFELLRFPIYDINASYIKEVLDSNDEIATYASLVYYEATNKFYKAIEPSNNIAPDSVDGALYWEEITDFTLDEIRESDKISIYVYNDTYMCRSRKCVRDYLLSIGCNCDDMAKYMNYFKRKAMLDGAQANSDSEKYPQAETNIRLLETMCPKC